MKQTKQKKMTILCIVILVIMQTRPAYAAWYQDATGWRYEHQGVDLRASWAEDSSGRYYLDAAGQMLTGWQMIHGSWYFLNPVSDGMKGRCLTGWQWIDGYCYYFNSNGVMLSDTTTPDGYQVNADGQWIEQGAAVYIPGQGCLVKSNQITTTGKASGGGNSSGSGKGNNTDAKTEDPNYNLDEEKDPTPAETATQSNTIYSYRVQYRDLSTKAILAEILGTCKKDIVIPIEHIEIGGYEICDNQPEQLQLTFEGRTENIYYQAIEEASPSEAKQINWEIRFVDSETHSITLATTRSGKIVQGGTLTVNFLNRIVKDGEVWEALEEPPMEITVYGTGNYIYYIEYVNIGSVPAEADKYQTEQELLDDCLATAKVAEAEITGESASRIPEARFYITNQAANSQRIQTIASQIDDAKEHVFYVIGKNYEPNGIGIPTYFGNEAVYSKILEAVIGIENDVYYVIRFTVKRVYDPDTCAHKWMLIRENEPTCLGRGVETWTCEKCDEEVECCLNPPGHIDPNQDSTCDRCGGAYDNQENPHKIHWQAGDIQARKIDSEIYMFECIDQNYSDRTENHRQAALFLCMSVIPSNTGSTYSYEEQLDGTYDYAFQPGPIVNFGNYNDYKYSSIRKWLEKNRSNFSGTEEINIGVDYVYMGSTASGRFSQLNDDQLQGYFIGNQKLTGNLFILSVDEALKYKEYLWRFNGSDSDNPESQYGAYSKAYWLRNPMGTAAEYNQTKQVYVVDLVNGSIHPQAIQPEDGGNADDEINITSTVGVRPAFAVPQN